jgi:hypothetical protein
MFLFFLFWFAPAELTFASARLKRGKKAPGERLPALTPVPDGVEFGKNLANLSRKLAASADHITM